MNLHAITKATEEKMDITMRDQDMKELIDDLVSRNMINRRMLTESDVDYSISDFGIEWWEKHGEALKQIL